DLRGGLRRVFLWVPAGAWPARCAGRTPRRCPEEAGELGARCGYPGLLRCHGPLVDHPFPRAPYRGQAHPAPDSEMAQGRRHRGWMRSQVGAPQGAVISPILANAYLHYAYDLWVQRWRQTKATGDMIVVRFADDQIVGFEHEHEAKAFLHDLHERLRAFELALHPDKTRLIRFGRHAAKQRASLGEGKPETFDFLGFTHFCTRSRKWGSFVIGRKTMKKRMRAKLKAVKV